MRAPGARERIFGNAPAPGAMPSPGGMFAHTLIDSLAGTVIGSAIAQHFLAAHPPAQGFGDLAQAGLGDATSDRPANDADRASTDDFGSDDEIRNDDLGSGDADSGDGGDFDLGDTFDV